jgi:sphinganine-1-phosphate aldolase
MTSGGSESIFLAMKAARDWARATGRSKSPEVVLPITAHPAFNKAAHYLGLKARRVPIGRDYRADPQAMEAAVGPDTIMIVGSAVAYPQGVIDPIREIGRIAVKHDLWMHVDACVGGFAAPFVRELGYPIRDFDFSVPGVSSMSADLHKYGFTAKGASTVLYRSAEHRQYQWFEFSEWPKGKYRTPNVTGTRPGGAVSAAWAVMNYLGKGGYRRVHRQVMEMRDRYIAGIQSIDGLKVIGQPDLGIVPYRSVELDIFAVAEQLSERGWYQSLLAEPSGIHLMLSLAHDPVMDEYLDDLRQAVKAVQRGEARASGKLVPVTY